VLAAAATIVLVWVTGRYVKLTHMLSKEAKDQFGEMMTASLDARMPVVAIDVASQYIVEVKIVRMTATIRNIGFVPADLILLFPRDWGEDVVLVSTVNPGDFGGSTLDAPVDPDAPIATSQPFTHRQDLRIAFDVMPQAGGVRDRFVWRATFDPADRAQPLDNSGGRTALHQGRSYVELERRENHSQLLALAVDEDKKNWRAKCRDTVSKLLGRNRVANPKNSTTDESLTREN